MAAATMASLPPDIMTMTAILAVIALAFTLSWTWIRRWGGGRAVTHLICPCHSLHHWRHLCLHSQDDGAKDNGCGDKRGRNPNIQGQEEVGHHNPIGMEEQKQKIKKNKKTKTKTKTKTNQQQWWQCHRLYACRQLHPCCHRCCLCVIRGIRDGITGVAVAAAAAEW
jgi:hypothetical protein